MPTDKDLTELAMEPRGAALPPTNKAHRYLIRDHDIVGAPYVSSTNDLGIYLPPGFTLTDTIGVDGLGTLDGRKGIPDFLRRASLKDTDR